jgi:hypothetical protein
MNQPKRSWPIRTILLTLSFFAILAIGFTATITTLPQLPDGSGGVFTYANLSQINTNATTANTNFTNVNTQLSTLAAQTGAAGGSPTGTGNLVLSIGPSIDLTNATGTPTGAGTSLSITKPLTLTQLQTLYSVGFQILPPPAATSMYVMGPCTLNLTYGSAAFTGGGAVSIGYGNTFASTTPSPLTHGTVAATVFTTFTASHGVVVIPAAVAVTVTTGLAGKAVFMSAATQDFASGTAGSGQVSCQYSIATGVS